MLDLPHLYLFFMDGIKCFLCQIFIDTDLNDGESSIKSTKFSKILFKCHKDVGSAHKERPLNQCVSADYIGNY